VKVVRARSRGPWRPFKKFGSRGFQLFDEQPVVRQPQPGEQFQVRDYLAQSVSITRLQVDHPLWAVTTAPSMHYVQATQA